MTKREQINMADFVVPHGRKIPSNKFEDKVRYFAECGFTAEEITDRIYLTSRFDDKADLFSDNPKPERTGPYYSLLSHVEKELARQNA